LAYLEALGNESPSSWPYYARQILKDGRLGEIWNNGLGIDNEVTKNGGKYFTSPRYTRLTVQKKSLRYTVTRCSREGDMG